MTRSTRSAAAPQHPHSAEPNPCPPRICRARRSDSWYWQCRPQAIVAASVGLPAGFKNPPPPPGGNPTSYCEPAAKHAAAAQWLLRIPPTS
jgi:hypothetical protein